MKLFKPIKLIVLCLIVLHLSSCFVLTNNFKRFKARSNDSFVKTNMLSLQTMLEVYAVDWGGVYPYTLEALYKESSQKHYFQEISNPFSKKEWNKLNPEGKGVVELYDKKNNVPGMIFYQPIVADNGKITNYAIRGNNHRGKELSSKHGPFLLKND